MLKVNQDGNDIRKIVALYENTSLKAEESVG
jgi:hypothetical protein